MNLVFDFHDSEVRCVQADADGLRVSFSAAHVLRAAEGGVGPAQAGHVRTLEMRFGAAAWTGRLGECIGRLSGGRVCVDGRAFRTIPLPWATQGRVSAELAFGNGALLSVEAGSLACRFAGDPGFTESLAC